MTHHPVVLAIPAACAALAISCAAADAARIETGAGCSLVDAITAANTNVPVGGCIAGDAGGDTVVLLGTTTLTSANNGSNGLPVVVEDLVITSPDPASRSFIARDNAPGTPDFRLLEIGTAADAPVVTLRRLYLQNGRVLGSITAGGVPAAGAGGCIFLRNGSLTVADTVIEECAAIGIDNPNGPASDAWGGAIAASAGDLTIRNSSFGFNTATGGETLAAGQPGGNAEGGAVFATGLTSLVVRNTSISTNFATGGASIARAGNGRGGGLTAFGTATSLIGTSFSANAASGGVASAGTSGTGLGGGLAFELGDILVTGGEFTANVVNGADSATGLAGYAFGGGLYGRAGTLTLDDTTISDNRATGGTGSSGAFNGIARGGGLLLSETTATAVAVGVEANSASGASPGGGGLAIVHENAPPTPFLMTRSTIASNTATATHGSAEGGGVYQDGDAVTIRNTGISGNSADTGGGLFQESGTMVVTLGTVSDNAATRRGGGLAAEGGLFAANTVELANATVSGNTAGLAGGGLFVEGAGIAPDLATLKLGNVTVVGNGNGGIQLTHDRSDPVLEAGNTIVGGQLSGADCALAGAAVITSSGGNLESGTSCAFTAGSDQQAVADLGLGPIADNGGRTLTHDLLPGSPAIDAGRQRPCARDANGKDQRGLARFYDGDGDGDFACDSGAVEAQGLLANPGFEDPLDPTADWSLAASGGGDGRAVNAATPNGRFVLLLAANGALETLSQAVPLAGGAGESYALSLRALGTGLTPGEGAELTLRSTLSGTAVDLSTCAYTFPSADFSAAAACELTSTGAFDFLEAIVAWDGATAGTLAIDAVSLTSR